MLNLSQLFKNMTTTITVTWISTILIGRLYDFHVAYHLILDKQDKESWLLEQCAGMTPDVLYHTLFLSNLGLTR